MRTFALAAGFALLLAACAASPPPPPSIDLTAITARLERDCASGAFSGVVAVDVRGERVLTHVCGVADVESRAMVTEDASFRIFSTSKTLTALAVMRLVDLGELQLDAPITTYLTDAPSSWSAITVRHLLQHTSGLPDKTNALLQAWRGDHAEAMATVLRESAEDAPATTPGQVWRYNNFGYELLAEIVERRRGQRFAAVLREEVFARAGMDDAIVEEGVYENETRSSVPDPLLVNGYNGSPEALSRASPLSFVQRGAGAVHATADDMLALGNAILERRVVSGANWAEMTAVLRRGDDDPANPPDRGYGLGVVVRGEAPLRYVGHDGGVNGYIAGFTLVPEHDAVVVALANRGFANVGWIPAEVASALAASDPD